MHQLRHLDPAERVSTVQPHPAPGQATPARTQDRMWHDVFLPEDVEHVREIARDLVATHLAPVAREIARHARVARLLPLGGVQWPRRRRMLRRSVPEPHGAGLEHPMLATCIVTEEIAYESSTMAGVYDGQCMLVARCAVVRTARGPRPASCRR